jgi:hypothetical protein
MSPRQPPGAPRGAKEEAVDDAVSAGAVGPRAVDEHDGRLGGLGVGLGVAGACERRNADGGEDGDEGAPDGVADVWVA